MKKIFILIVLLIIVFSFDSFYKPVYAEEKDVNEVVDNIIDGIENEGLDKIISETGFDKSLSDIIRNIISGGVDFGREEVVNVFTVGISDELKNNLKYISIIVIIIILSSLVTVNKFERVLHTDEIISYVCLSAIFVVLSTRIVELINLCKETIETLTQLVEISTPICVSLLTVCGATNSAFVCKPVTSFFNTVVLALVNKCLIPLSFSILLISVLGSLTNAVKFDQLKEFLTSTAKWILGIVFTSFSVLFSIEGVVASKLDGVGYRLGKFAVSNSLPLVGGYIGSSMEIIVSACSMVKNSLGLIGIVIVLIVILKPVISTLLFSLTLKLIAGISESFADGKIIKTINGFSVGLGYFVACVLTVGFCLIVFFTVIVAIGNIVV